MKTSTDLFRRAIRRLLLLATFGLPGVVLAGPYPGSLKDHGHTGTGDGGLITNLTLSVSGKYGVGGSSITSAGITASSGTYNKLVVDKDGANNGNGVLVGTNTAIAGGHITVLQRDTNDAIVIDSTSPASTIRFRARNGAGTNVNLFSLGGEGGWQGSNSVDSYFGTITNTGFHFHVNASALNAMQIDSTGQIIMNETQAAGVSIGTSTTLTTANVFNYENSGKYWSILRSSTVGGSSSLMQGSANGTQFNLQSQGQEGFWQGNASTEAFIASHGARGLHIHTNDSASTNIYFDQNANTIVPNTHLRVGPAGPTAATFQVLPVIQSTFTTFTSACSVTANTFTDCGTAGKYRVGIGAKFSSSKIRLQVSCPFAAGTSATSGQITIERDSTNLGDATNGFFNTATHTSTPITFFAWDAPGDTTVHNYDVFIKSDGVNSSVANVGAGTCTMEAVEYAQ